MSMHHVSAVHQLPAADGGMPDFGQMRKADLMKAAKAIGVPTRRQCTRDDGSTYRTWRSTTDVARECQQAWHEQSERHIAPGAVSTVPGHTRSGILATEAVASQHLTEPHAAGPANTAQAQATDGRNIAETATSQQLNESDAPGSASAVQAQITAGRIATETAASHQFNESHAACSANAVQPQTGLETLAPGTATAEQIQEFTAPASARAVLAQNPSETLAPHADRGNSTEVGSQTPTSTSQAVQLKRRSLLDHWIRKPGPPPVVAAPDVARERQQAWHEQSERHIAPGAVSAVQAQATAGRIAIETTSAQQLNESHAPSSASAMQAQIIAGRIVTETAASHQFNESHTPGSANAVQAQTGLETLAAGTATSQQIQEFTAPASARAVPVQNLSETHASHADTGNSTKVSSQTPTATSQAFQLKRRSLLDHWIRKPGPAPVIDAPAHSAPVSGSAHRRSAAMAYETIQRMGPTLAGLRERIVCALCPRSPTVGACDWCARRVCRGCLDERTGECWVCLGYEGPQAGREVV